MLGRDVPSKEHLCSWMLPLVTWSTQTSAASAKVTTATLVVSIDTGIPLTKRDTNFIL